METLGLASFECNAIIAQSKNGVIGINNNLPWNIKEDLRNFRLLTIHNIVVMGRKTYESLPVKKLDKRINIVITREPEKCKNEEDLYFGTLEQSVEYIKKLYNNSQKKIFIIGGAEIYKLFIDHYDKLYITYVDETVKGDAFTPFTDKYLEKNYKLISSSEKQSNNILNYYYKLYEKIHSL